MKIVGMEYRENIKKEVMHPVMRYRRLMTVRNFRVIK